MTLKNEQLKNVASKDLQLRALRKNTVKLMQQQQDSQRALLEISENSQTFITKAAQAFHWHIKNVEVSQSEFYKEPGKLLYGMYIDDLQATLKDKLLVAQKIKVLRNDINALTQAFHDVLPMLVDILRAKIDILSSNIDKNKHVLEDTIAEKAARIYGCSSEEASMMAKDVVFSELKSESKSSDIQCSESGLNFN